MLDPAVFDPTQHFDKAPSSVQNAILATLPEAEFGLFRPHLKPVPLKRNEILQEALRYPDAAYFIESGVVSRVVRTVRDGPVEVAVVGKFGFVGVSLVLGTMQTIQRSVVRVPEAHYASKPMRSGMSCSGARRSGNTCSDTSRF